MLLLLLSRPARETLFRPRKLYICFYICGERIVKPGARRSIFGLFDVRPTFATLQSLIAVISRGITEAVDCRQTAGSHGRDDKNILYGTSVTSVNGWTSLVRRRHLLSPSFPPRFKTIVLSLSLSSLEHTHYAYTRLARLAHTLERPRVCVTRVWPRAISFTIMHVPSADLSVERSSPSACFPYRRLVTFDLARSHAIWYLDRRRYAPTTIFYRSIWKNWTRTTRISLPLSPIFGNVYLTLLEYFLISSYFPGIYATRCYPARRRKLAGAEKRNCSELLVRFVRYIATRLGRGGGDPPREWNLI